MPARPAARPKKTVRADAQRNIDTLLEAAKTVFMTSGVDAPVREIALEAGVGLGTVYRHFPERSHLVAAVFRREVDACASAATALAAEHEPVEALSRWLWRYASFIATKRGLAAALHSGDRAFEALPAYFQQHLGPALDGLLRAARDAGQIRADVDSDDLIAAVRNLSVSSGDDPTGHSKRMVALLVDGLRFGARGPVRKAKTKQDPGRGRR